MTTLIADPAWRAQAHPEGLVVYAGADLTYLVPDLGQAEIELLAKLFELEQPFDSQRLPGPVRQVLPQLRALGALRPGDLPTPATPRALSVSVRVLGNGHSDLSAALEHQLSIVDEPAADLVLVIRTTGTLQDVIDLSGRLSAAQQSHLLLDVAYHHTATLGPLVVPGSSACLECMATRTGGRWGDPMPPSVPAALRAPELPVALAAHAIRRISAGSLALLERIVSFDLDELTTSTEDVLPSAGCPSCSHETPGRVLLPWEKES